MRSIITSCSDSPGTSTPCHSEIVPNSTLPVSAENFCTRVFVESSPWQSTVPSQRPRRSSAACFAARIEENSPSARPPAARTSPSISSSTAGESPSRPGGGRWRAT